MRTTVAIDDHLLKAAKRRAGQLGITLGQLMERGLRRELTSGDSDRVDPPIPRFDGKTGPLPGVDLSSNRAIHELLDDGVPVAKRR